MKRRKEDKHQDYCFTHVCYFWFCCQLFFFSACWTLDTYTHAPTDIPSWTRLVLLQVTLPVSPNLYINVCMCFIYRVNFSLNNLTRSCNPLWCIQHSWLYACMYLCIMNCVKMHIYSLYVFIYSCSTWPLDFVIPRKLKKHWTTLHARSEGTLLPVILKMVDKHHCCSIWKPWYPLPVLEIVTWSVFPAV